ncbi:Phosphatase YidA [uncultured Clostridium sp.]|nr:Phosphatase YidA [uncultured Clostridium sp.]
MNNIKVIIMDVDGTLTNNKKIITKKTKDALINAQKSGAKLVLASGRPTSGLIDFAKELKMDKNNGLLVSFNGSKVVDCQTNKVLFNETISIEHGQAVLEHLKKFKVKPMIDKEDYLYVNNVFDNEIEHDGKPFNVIQYESRGGNFKLCEEHDLASFATYPLNKILTAGDSKYLKENYIEIMEPFKDILSCMFTSPFYLEFTAKGIDKAKALDSVLVPMGYKIDEMIAFGDGHNDISMIKYVGIGVAMDNAVDDLKSVSNKITLSNEDDGIAHALSDYFDCINI